MMEVISYLLAHWMELLIGLQGVLGGALLISLAVPGEQPDKFLQSVVDMMKKLSNSKK